MAGRARVFIATSLDGFIAGENDDLSWLPPPVPGDDFGFATFLSQTGALLMGRRTYDVAAGFPGEWAYGERPVLVPTRRPLTPKVPSVRAVSGPITELVAQAKEAANGLDVYLDGGDVIRQAHDAGLVDELTVTVVPVILGRGYPLFAGVAQRSALTLLRSAPLLGGLVQLTYVPARPA
ncbi:MAG: dihydrofolate reductase [Archangium sp.]|nr:dihydrofolate reductase [Archangium sp.]